MANANELADQVDPVYGYLDERSCSSVSVNGRHVTGVNETTPVIPASNQKLLVAAVALELLGADFRYTTRVAGPPPVDGVDRRRRVPDRRRRPAPDVVGLSRSPTTASRRSTSRRSTSSPTPWSAAGVTRINGSVLGDGSRYDDEYEVDTWGEGVAGVEAGPYDALMVNDSRAVGRSGRQADPNEAAARELVRLLDARGITVSGGFGRRRRRSGGSRHRLDPVGARSMPWSPRC